MALIHEVERSAFNALKKELERESICSEKVVVLLKVVREIRNLIFDEKEESAQEVQLSKQIKVEIKGLTLDEDGFRNLLESVHKKLFGH
jgi:hypothetical protein